MDIPKKQLKFRSVDFVRVYSLIVFISLFNKINKKCVNRKRFLLRLCIVCKNIVVCLFVEDVNIIYFVDTVS